MGADAVEAGLASVLAGPAAVVGAVVAPGPGTGAAAAVDAGVGAVEVAVSTGRAKPSFGPGGFGSLFGVGSTGAGGREAAAASLAFSCGELDGAGISPPAAACAVAWIMLGSSVFGALPPATLGWATGEGIAQVVLVSAAGAGAGSSGALGPAPSRWANAVW